MKRLLSVLVAAVTALVGVGPATPTSAQPVAAATHVPLAACDSLLGVVIDPTRIALPTTGAVVESAALIPATATLPEYCSIRGKVQPVDLTAQPIRFVIGAPTEWNGASWQLGGGGMNGNVPDVTSASVTLPGQPGMLAQHYVTFGGDSGHDVNDFTWWFNEEAFLNFAHEEIKKTHDAAMAILEEAYGQRSNTHARWTWRARSCHALPRGLRRRGGAGSARRLLEQYFEPRDAHDSAT